MKPTIYITTYGRGAVQPAYEQLDAAGLRPWLVVDERDTPWHADYPRVIEGEFKDLRGKRDFLWCRHWETKTPFVLMDDDLIICTSRNGETITPAPIRDLQRLFHGVMPHLWQRGAVQVGVHHRPFVNHAPKPYTYNSGTFPFRVMGYNPKAWKECPRPCPTHSGSDIWLWHELVRQGLDYAVITEFCHSDKLHRGTPTHYTDEAKAREFNELIDHMGFDRARFTSKRSDGKRACNILYTKLAQHYRGEL